MHLLERNAQKPNDTILCVVDDRCVCYWKALQKIRYRNPRSIGLCHDALGSFLSRHEENKGMLLKH